MTKQMFPEIPKLPHMSGKEIFEDKKKAKKWFEILHRRRAALAELISTTSASMYSKSGKEEEEFIIVAPCTNGECRFQMTKFDKYGAVYDAKRNDAKEIAKEIPNSYQLVGFVVD